MGKTESFFAGILALGVLIAILLVVFNDGSDRGADPRRTTDFGSERVFGGFNGVADDDLCTCYEQAYAYGSQGISIESLEYKGGFAECGRRVGRDGGLAWTEGWQNGEVGRGGRTCGAWLSSGR